MRSIAQSSEENTAHRGAGVQTPFPLDSGGLGPPPSEVIHFTDKTTLAFQEQEVTLGCG